MHSKTKRAMSLVNENLVVLMKHVKNIATSRGCVHTPSDLAGGIAHGEEISNTVVEQIYIHPQSTNMMTSTEVHENDVLR